MQNLHESSGGDPSAGGRAEFKVRIAEARGGASGWRPAIERLPRAGEPARPERARGKGRAPGATPVVPIGLLAAAGIIIGLGAIFGLRSDGASTGGSPEGAASQAPAAQAAAGPVVVQKLPEEAVDDYYILLGQGMYDVAWNRTTDAFRSKNYPGGYDSYLKTWTGSSEIEVVSRTLVWTGNTSARVLADLHDTGSGDRFAYSLSLVYDSAAKMWKIDGIDPAG